MISIADEAHIKEKLQWLIDQGNTYYITIKDGQIEVDDKHRCVCR